MNTLQLTDEQLRLVQTALDFYSRVGIGQFNVIKDHPTFEKHLHKEFALGSGKFKVGDATSRGEVVEVDKKYKWIKTKGHWGNGEEIKKWTDLENIYYTTDYQRYHAVRDAVDMALTHPRNMLYNDHELSLNGSWGIHHPSVDDSCRLAFDIVQVIRHEFWKNNPKRSEITVDSHIHFTSTKGESNKIKCNLDV
jgi:hypothetical protein